MSAWHVLASAPSPVKWPLIWSHVMWKWRRSRPDDDWTAARDSDIHLYINSGFIGSPSLRSPPAIKVIMKNKSLERVTGVGGFIWKPNCDGWSVSTQPPPFCSDSLHVFIFLSLHLLSASICFFFLVIFLSPGLISTVIKFSLLHFRRSLSLSQNITFEQRKPPSAWRVYKWTPGGKMCYNPVK